MARAWFAYKGFGDYELTNSYLYSVTHPNSKDGNRICAIRGIYTGSKYPLTISDNLLRYIGTGLATGNAQPQSPSSSVKYVYMITLG